MSGEGCLVFATGMGSIASLTLDYHFHDPTNLASGVSFIVANPSQNAFLIAAFYEDSMGWHYAAADLVDHGAAEPYLFFGLPQHEGGRFRARLQPPL
jgi:hypothetical protein